MNSHTKRRLMVLVRVAQQWIGIGDAEQAMDALDQIAAMLEPQKQMDRSISPAPVQHVTRLADGSVELSA